MRVLVVGAGGIGGLLASRLSLSKRVSKLGMVLRSNYESVLKEGLTVKSNVLGDISFMPTDLYYSRDIDEAKRVEWDHILVCCKTTATADFSKEVLAPVLECNPDAFIHLVQNGVGIEEPVHRMFPSNQLVTVSAFVRSASINPTTINHTGPKLFTFGFFNSSSPSDKHQRKLEEFTNVLSADGGIECKISKDIQWVRFHKLAWNASFNPLSIICGQVGVIELLEHEPTRRLITDIHKEVFELATALLGPRPAYLDDYIEFVERGYQIQKQNGEYHPSMLLDYKSGKPLEMDAILNNAIQIGKSIGSSMPKLEAIAQILAKLAIRL